MKYFLLFILSCLWLPVIAQKQLTIVNSETGEETTITVPDGLVITTGYEDGNEDMVVTDTLYADDYIDANMMDSVACDTAALIPFISADDVFSLAKKYRDEGRTIEMVLSLYQSWLLGNMDVIDTYIAEHKDVQNALSFMMYLDEELKRDTKQNLDYLKSMIPDNDYEMCLIAEILKLRLEESDIFEALKTFRTETYKKHGDNPFYKYLNAIIEYDDANEYKCAQQNFSEMKAVADEGIELAFSELARRYANGRGTDKDTDKAIEYFQKTVDAGLLEKSAAQDFLYFLDNNPEITISDDLKAHLIRTITISLPYWLNIQERLNHLKTW